MREKAIQYPTSPRTETCDNLHGTQVPDPYRWLEEIDSEQTKAWIAAQNTLTAEYLERVADRESIRRRMTELWDYEKFGVPFKRGRRTFLTRNDGLQNQDILYWMESPDHEPRVLLDPNELSEDGTVALLNYAVSEDGKLLAYGLSALGSDWQEWHVREVDTGRDLDDHLQWVKFSGASWTTDGQGFFYSGYDEPEEGTTYKGANYNQKLYYHRLGSPQLADRLIYHRPDHKEWGINGHVTEDGRTLIITVRQRTRRENAIFYRDLGSGDAPIIELLNRFDAIYHFLGKHGTVLFFLTDLEAPMSRVIGIDITQPDRTHWREIIPESRDALQDVSLVGGRFIATYLHDAHSHVKVYDMEGNLQDEIDLPTIGTVTGFPGREGDTETFYHFSGFTTPGTVYRYDLTTGQSTVFREPKVAFSPQDYETRQIFYESKDGTLVPMFISHRKGLVPDPNTPAYLFGYGGFDNAQTPSFSVPNLVWMEMGGIYTLANLRGGGEYGKAWHEAGMKANKQNVFDDFITAAEWLIERGYTSRARLAIGGRSNGGLLVGACMTRRPDLFGACLPVVGVMDMLRFHKFTIGWAWVSDYGSPDDPEDFRVLLAYSPYHNVHPGILYPPTLIATGDHDDRVFPAHSYKFAAALQSAQAGPAPILIRIDTKTGHKLGKPTSKLIEEWTDMWAFLVDALQIAAG